MTDRQDIAVDSRVEAGEPGSSEFDTGRVVEIDGDMATVAWDKGEQSSHPISELRAASA